MNPIYKIQLDDYSVPAFVTLSKPYFGTIEDICSLEQKVINKFKERYSDETCKILYNKDDNLKIMTVLKRRECSFENYKWEHKNIWCFPYYMKAKLINVFELLLKDDTSFYRCAKLIVKDLQYTDGIFINEWDKLIGGFWGFPEMIYYDEEKDSLISSMYYCQKQFGSEEDALNDFSVNDVSFEGFCNDIFGDG